MSGDRQPTDQKCGGKGDHDDLDVGRAVGGEQRGIHGTLLDRDGEIGADEDAQGHDPHCDMVVVVVALCGFVDTSHGGSLRWGRRDNCASQMSSFDADQIGISGVLRKGG